MPNRRFVINQQKELDLIKAYRLFQKLTQFPKLLDSIREIFLDSLSKSKIVDADALREETVAWLRQEGIALDEANIREYSNVLIDLYFANFFSEEEIENHINLARKRHRFNQLNRVINKEGATSKNIKHALAAFCEIPIGDLHIPPSQAEGARVSLINHFISNQLPFIGIGKRHITVRDIHQLVDNMYWSRRRPGRIGGKAAGMFLAYKILVPTLSEGDPDIERYVRIPESYYFNSGIFSDFIDFNNLDQFHTQKYKTREAIEEDYQYMAELFKKAIFPPDVMNDFRQFLLKIGEHPLILRSSSLLEDNFGYAFSGKYDSVFITNQGDIEKRLNEFVWGLKQVHMSTYGPDPILYRRDHDLIDFDERMSVLVQKVVGRRFGKYFFPFAAGVGFSFSSYSWTPRIKKEDGFLRIVFGLGTGAVDRVAQGYPRMVHLSHPMLRPEVEIEQIKKYSQKKVDVLNLSSGQLEPISYIDLLNEIGHPDAYYALSLEQEGHLSPPLFKTDAIHPDTACITFENLLSKTIFPGLMKKILNRLQAAYSRPVDVEFAWDDDHLYILQCRSLATSKDIGQVDLPKDIPREQILFTNNQVVANSIVKDIEYVIYVCPKTYEKLSTYEDKITVGRVVSRLNHALHDKRYALFGPGRWGSNDINLGVKVGYQDINRTLILGEIAFEKAGYTAEVSYGTHFFNDLVEAQITPIAIFPDQGDAVFKEDFFIRTSNQLASLAPDLTAFQTAVHVIHVPASSDGRYLQVYQNSQEQKGIGFLALSE